jgi:hypothetical protein
MTQQTRSQLQRIGLDAILLAFAVGVAWGVSKAQLAQKLDTDRFVVDSINKANVLREMLDGVREANGRLREIQCGVPPRPGCR